MDFHLLLKKRGRGRETAKLNNSLRVREKSDPPLGKQLTFSILSDTHPTHPLALLRTGTLNHLISKKQGLLLSYNTNYSSCISFSSIALSFKSFQPFLCDQDCK